MPTVTALVHTKNSAKTLEKCLRSVQWCDEVFVIDMNRSDDTVEIAKKMKATIFVESDKKFADPVRNIYLQKVKTDWTFILDSDEEAPLSLSQYLRECMNRNDVNGFRIPRSNIIFGKQLRHSGFWPDYIIRFFRTGTCTYPPYVHAQPEVLGVVEDIPARDEFALLHHHYDSVEQYMMRVNVYTSLEVEARKGKIKAFEPHFFQAFFGEFFRRFYMQKGYADGMHGFVVSLLQSVYMLVVELKTWEALGKVESPVRYDSVGEDIERACQQRIYWVANEKLSQGGSFISNVWYRCIRKIYSS